MNYQRFIEQLPGLFRNWGQDSVEPKTNQFQQALKQVQGTTTANVMQLLNFAVQCMESNEVYCEVGTDQGAALIGALLNHSEQMAYSIRESSEVDVSSGLLERLVDNLVKFDLQEQVCLCNQKFEDFALQLRELETEDRIGVYFYDGVCDYRSQLIGLLLIKPILAKKALIVVSNSNFRTVKQASWDFIAVNSECQMLLDLSTSTGSHSPFGNGIHVFSWDVERSYNYSLSTFCQMRQPSVVQAFCNLQLLEQREEELNALYSEALLLHGEKKFVAAERKYEEFLLSRSHDAEAWLNLGILYYETEDYAQSLSALLKSLKIDASNAWLHYIIGSVFEKVNDARQAISAYSKAIILDPKLIDAHNNLGKVLVQLGEMTQAEAVYRQAIAVDPTHSGSYLNFGNLLMEQNQIDQAIEVYQTALNLSPNNADVSNNLTVALNVKNDPDQFFLDLGDKLYQARKYEQAIEQYQSFLEIQTGDVELYLKLSACFISLNRVEEFIDTLEESIRLYPTDGRLHFSLIVNLQRIGRTQEAISKANAASQALPDDYTFTILKKLIVPVIYNTPDEINFYRQHFVKGLQSLVQQTFLENPEAKKNALAGIGHVTNFYLPFQAHNDLELQRQYGNLVHQITAANFPNWVQPLSMPSLEGDEKIRIGYVSAYLHSYSGTLWLTGWLHHCDQSHFEVYCYYTGNEPDAVTQIFQEYSDVFRHIPRNLVAACEQIVADQIHILIFPEIGMDPQTVQMASLRLAPVQCTAWGHPVTSGLPTIDYFLSSELMEPPNALEHYSETLIRLPNIGVSYPKPDIPPLTKTRANYQLQEDAVIYLCCQAPFKYLPQYDFIFAEIARRVSQAQFVFLRGSLLQQRLQRTFAAASLRSEDYCVFLTVPDRHDYLMINLLSDVYLDTLSWSGGNTTLEAIACNLPIVTCPGEFMRGRHSYSFLKMLEVAETIAQTEAEYVEIAVDLGLRPVWRREIAQRMNEQHDLLYDDKACVAALETFYNYAIRESSINT